MKQVTTLGIDLAKNVFHLHGVDEHGKVVLKRKIARNSLLSTVAQLPSCLIGLEACCGSNYWAREFQKLGHEVKIMSPQFVRPYVKSNKNDMADAEAICEAVTRPNMRFVNIKTVAAQDIQSIHRVRQRIVASKNALCNEIRGLLSEYGIVIPQGIHKLKAALPTILEDMDNQLTPSSRELFRDLYNELTSIIARVKEYDKKILKIYKENESCKRIGEIPGVGKLTATAILAVLPSVNNFKNGREFSAWLGLVPKQFSTGGKEKLLGISKRGDRYIRTLLIHGARVLTCRWPLVHDPRKAWLGGVVERRGYHRATVALANKNARIIWALVTKNETYKYVA